MSVLSEFYVNVFPLTAMVCPVSVKEDRSNFSSVGSAASQHSVGPFTWSRRVFDSHAVLNIYIYAIPQSQI